MTLSIALLLAIIAVAVVLFWLEWISADVVALGIVLVLILCGLVPPDRAFAGFGSDAFMMILGLLIMTAALLRTGVVELAGRKILKHTGDDPERVLLVVTLTVAALSAVMSNTAAVAFFLPVAVGMCSRGGISPSKMLLPMAFASIVTSSVTLISTSTNIVISDLITRGGLAPFGMFELAPAGVPIAVAGLLYLWFVGRRLIPERSVASELTDQFGLRPYLTEIVVLATSPLLGKTVRESQIESDLDLTVLALVRDQTRFFQTIDMKLGAGDVLIVEGLREEILKVKDEKGIDIVADAKLSDPDLQSEDTKLVEVILLPRSPLIGKTLKRSRLHDHHRLQVLAIHRAGATLRQKVSEVVLRLGDVLLLQGLRDNITALEEQGAFRVFGAVDGQRPKLRSAPWAAAIFVLAIAVAATGIVSLPVAALAGAVTMFVTRCITPEEAYREVDWRVLILVGSMLGLGAAMEHTGAAKYLGGLVLQALGTAHPSWLLTGFFVLTLLLTQPMSNQAAAAVVVPIALATAEQIGVNPRPFAVMIAVAASCSYLTPLEPACLLVLAPGRYRFGDFLRVGWPLTVVVYLVAILIVPQVWPLDLA